LADFSDFSSLSTAIKYIARSRLKTSSQSFKLRVKQISDTWSGMPWGKKKEKPIAEIVYRPALCGAGFWVEDYALALRVVHFCKLWVLMLNQALYFSGGIYCNYKGDEYGPYPIF
jgi:hypothetical protein